MLLNVSDLNTQVTVPELLAELVPPLEFSKVTFSTYLPDPNFPSQSVAARLASDFAKGTSKKVGKNLGIYLDGGFGVGKTHLLAATFHASKGKKIFGSFIAYTSIIGYLGFAEAVKEFGNFDLLCIDEFELDDPGDTMIMSRFLKELANKGVRFAATSNTPPTALGAGRFAADSFQREIQSVANRFEMVRIDGEDYRHRNATYNFEPISAKDLALFESHSASSTILKISFDDLLRFLASIHQSRYAKVAEQFAVLVLEDVRLIEDQFEGIRLVSFIDRCYEAGISLRYSGQDLAHVFREDHLAGAYRKKYLRCLSRLFAMTQRELA
ncbi:MAG: cell division protein ZapE [Actinobacteria bacterium]|nr:cell division protein ZapE [Actinomycetota bacterium]